MFSNLSLAQILVALVLVSLSLAAAQQSDVIIISNLHTCQYLCRHHHIVNIINL